MKRCSLGILLLCLFMGSCSKVVYLDNMVPEDPYFALTSELKIRKGNKLSIVVNSKNPEVAAPFNVNSGVSYQVAGNGEVSTARNLVSSSMNNGYRVDESGMIDFPILGRLFIGDLTCDEISELIETRLIKEQYIDDPTVIVTMLDMKIIVMGEVQRNGSIPIDGDGMNLLEAITLSGGITQNAAPNKVCVLRKEEGVLRKYQTDIRSTDLFKSPCYSLQQDDVVYVLPRSAKITVKEERGWRIFSVGTGLASLVISLLVLLK